MRVVVVSALDQLGEAAGLENEIECGAEVGLATGAEIGCFKAGHRPAPSVEAIGFGKTGLDLASAILSQPLGYRQAIPACHTVPGIESLLHVVARWS